MENIDKLEKQKESSNQIPKLGIPELDDLSFGLEKVWSEYLKRYEMGYQKLYLNRKYPPKKEFEWMLNSYNDTKILEKDGCLVFGLFKALIDMKDQEYSQKLLQKLLDKYRSCYKYPNINKKEKEKIKDVPAKMKKIFEEFELSKEDEPDSSRIDKKNLARVFYLLFLDRNYPYPIKYTQQKIDFGFDK